jgi:aryl-alcohol dehydrogenase-like predicted oxidoreductase
MTTDDVTAPGGVFRLGGDLTIGRLGFGAMRLPRGSLDGPIRDPQQGMAVLRKAVELGVSHIDTAWFYRAGQVAANDLIRQALSPYQPGLVIATKVGPLLGPEGRPSGQSDPAGLRALVEQDLASLGVDRLDLVYLRIGGMGVPSGESLAERFEVLAGLAEEGLIRHLGVSNVDRVQLAEARSIAPVAAVQNHFHVHRQQQDAGLLAECESAGIAFVPFFPLGGGADAADAASLEPAAGRHGATVAQVALAWLLARSPVMLPIPGTGSLAHLEENMRSVRLIMNDRDLAGLAPQPESPGGSGLQA